jgi:hypothetical protein
MGMQWLKQMTGIFGLAGTLAACGLADGPEAATTASGSDHVPGSLPSEQYPVRYYNQEGVTYFRVTQNENELVVERILRDEEKTLARIAYASNLSGASSEAGWDEGVGYWETTEVSGDEESFLGKDWTELEPRGAREAWKADAVVEQLAFSSDSVMENNYPVRWTTLAQLDEEAGRMGLQPIPKHYFDFIRLQKDIIWFYDYAVNRREPILVVRGDKPEGEWLHLGEKCAALIGECVRAGGEYAASGTAHKAGLAFGGCRKAHEQFEENCSPLL